MWFVCGLLAKFLESGIANQPRKTYCTCKFSRDFAFTFYSLFSHLCMLFVFTNFWSVVFISVSCYISWELGSIYWLKNLLNYVFVTAEMWAFNVCFILQWNWLSGIKRDIKIVKSWSCFLWSKLLEDLSQGLLVSHWYWSAMRLS